MNNEKKESRDPQEPKEIAFRIRQQESIIVSPIDLTLENAQELHAEQLQWLNFYEPPLKLSLSNIGDTVMIRGQWFNLHQRPTLFGGPLDGHYVFSQAHFHWDSPSHSPAKHTINGKGINLEMHALFYKSCYQDQAEAQEKEDGVVIVVYFFKMEQGSSFKWMTDHLGHVTVPKANTRLPPAPLCALMVPFTKDYLAYYGALACSCHHVLWLVSQTPLRITDAEMENFGKVQSIPKEPIDLENINNVKTAHRVYRINSSSDRPEVVFFEATNPPCQISATPNKITIAVDYAKMMTTNETTNETTYETTNEITNLTTNETKNKTTKDFTEDEPKHENSEDISLNNFVLQGRGIEIKSYSDWKTDLKESESNVQLLCNLCKKNTVYVNGNNKINCKSTRRRIVVAKKCVLESDKIDIVGKMRLLEKDRKKGNKSVEFWKRENETNRRLLKREREQMKLMKKAWADQMKKFAEMKFEAEELRRLAEKCETDKTKKVEQNSEPRETSDDGVVDEENNCPRRIPRQKSVLTTKPKTTVVDKNNLQSEGENVEADINCLEVNDQSESSKNSQLSSKNSQKSSKNSQKSSKNSQKSSQNSQKSSQNSQKSSKNFQSEATGDQISIKEEKVTKKKVEPKSKLPKAKKNNNSSLKPQEGLKSSLTPFFSGRDRSLQEKEQVSPPGNNVKGSSLIPKYGQRIVNRTRRPQDQNPKNSKQAQSKVSINYL